MTTYPSVELGDPGFAEVILGQSPTSDTYNSDGVGLPFFQGKADFGLVSPTPRVWCTAGIRFAEIGDTLVSVRAPVGDVNLATARSAIGRGIAAIRAGDQTDAWFLFFALLDAKETLAAQATGSTFASVNRSTLESLEVPRPELATQREIARVLLLALGAIDQEGQVLVATETLKRAVMQELFTRGLRGGEPHDSEIGPIPAGWQVRPISELCEIWSGGTPRKGVEEFWEGSIPWVSGKDLKQPVISDAIDHVSEVGVASGSRLAPADAVMLLVRGMGLAKDLPVATITRPMAFNQDVKSLTLKSDHSAHTGRFLRSAIHAGKERLLSQIVASAHGTMTLNLNDVESMMLAWPATSDEALEVVEVIDALEAKIDLHRHKQQLYEELFQALLHSLMSRGIDVNDLDLSALPAREAASA